MLRCPDLPLLPGFSFNPNIGQTRFHKSQHFERINNLPTLSEKVKSGIGGTPLPGSDLSRYPSVYARGEVAELPAWIVYDKQILTFDAFFQETMHEVPVSPFQVRLVKIYFFLEDGTIKIIEPKIDNSGIPQGTLLSRQRIPFPPPRNSYYYDIIDFNIGRELEFFGRIFKLTNCDKFTRTFLNRCGIAVPDPINTPEDPYRNIRARIKDGMLPKKPNSTVDTRGQFLAHDRQVLKFYGYWDDRDSDYGILHELEIYYFLADDTIQLKETVPPNSGRDTGFMFLKRGKLPKRQTLLPGPGDNTGFTVLNVLGANSNSGRYVLDSLNCGETKNEYYKENDLTIGAAINVYGKKIIITDCDPYTREYYRAKYGLDDFTKAERPEPTSYEDCHGSKYPELPPWNGYGTYEDSATNCRKLELKPPHQDFQKYLQLSRQGLDSHVLRFTAKMISKIPENCERNFIISSYLEDDSISIYESAGSGGKMFFARDQMLLPGEEIFANKRPKCYTAQHLYIGARINIRDFIFVLTDADEYALRYMELHSDQFPKSDINVVMAKVREALRPIYKQFVAEHLPKEEPIIPYETLRYSLCKIMGDALTEHELITIARHFQPECVYQRYTRNDIRAFALTEMKKNLWNDLDRLGEYFRQRDSEKTGFLPRKDVYFLCRASRLPFDVYLLDNILDVICKNEQCELDYNDLLLFLDLKWNPVPDVIPINLKSALYWGSEKVSTNRDRIDWCKFNKCLNLEDTIIKQSE